MLHDLSECVVSIVKRKVALQAPGEAVASHEALSQGNPSEHKPGDLPNSSAAADKGLPTPSKSEVTPGHTDSMQAAQSMYVLYT